MFLLFKKIIAEDLSVRKVEALVRQLSQSKPKSEEKTSKETEKQQEQQSKSAPAGWVTRGKGTGPGGSNWNPFTSEFWIGAPGEGDTSYGSGEGIRDVEVGSELEGFATDPKSSLEYYLSVPTGYLDTGIGLYNMATPGPDIPQLPKFENQGAQLVRDASSLLGPGGLANKGIKAVGAGARGLQGAGIAGRTGALCSPSAQQPRGSSPEWGFWRRNLGGSPPPYRTARGARVP